VFCTLQHSFYCSFFQCFDVRAPPVDVSNSSLWVVTIGWCDIFGTLCCPSFSPLFVVRWPPVPAELSSTTFSLDTSVHRPPPTLLHVLTMYTAVLVVYFIVCVYYIVIMCVMLRLWIVALHVVLANKLRWIFCVGHCFSYSNQYCFTWSL